MTQLNIQGSSWQQPKLASSGTVKYLWRWSCHCLGLYRLSPDSFSKAASPRCGVWCRAKQFLSPAATLSPPAVSLRCHTAVSTHRLGPNILLSIKAKQGGYEFQAEAPTHPHSDHKETGALCYSLLTTNNSGLSTGQLAETGLEGL